EVVLDRQTSFLDFALNLPGAPVGQYRLQQGGYKLEIAGAAGSGLIGEGLDMFGYGMQLELLALLLYLCLEFHLLKVGSEGGSGIPEGLFIRIQAAGVGLDGSLSGAMGIQQDHLSQIGIGHLFFCLPQLEVKQFPEECGAEVVFPDTGLQYSTDQRGVYARDGLGNGLQMIADITALLFADRLQVLPGLVRGGKAGRRCRNELVNAGRPVTLVVAV